MNRDPLAEVVRRAARPVRSAASDVIVAWCTGRGQEAKADAQLLAEAKNLLASVKELLAEFDPKDEHRGLCHDDPACPVARAHALVARAEGLAS